jgi:heme/copper-type cytochrome/quinol oxidase subunit 4
MSNGEAGVQLHDGDIAPGDERADGTEIAEGIRGYLIGLGLSVLATVVAFFLTGT